PEIRDRAARRQALRRQVPGVHPRRRAHHLRPRVGPAARVEHAAGAGAPLRSGHRRGARLLPDRSRELARRAEPRRVKPVVRRRALLVGVGLLVAVLVGGRWLALETAERAWGASLPGGTAYLTTRDFARLVSGLLLVGAIAWATANLLFVYRSIGSMQLSRGLRQRRGRAAVRGDRLAAVPSLAALCQRTRPRAPRRTARVARAHAHVGRLARSGRVRRGTARDSHGSHARPTSRRRARGRGHRHRGHGREPRVGPARETDAAGRGLECAARGVAVGIRRHSRLALERWAR